MQLSVIGTFRIIEVVVAAQQFIISDWGLTI